MDVINPNLLWLGNCCYRLPEVCDTNVKHSPNLTDLQVSMEETYDDEEEEEDNDDITETNSGKFILRYSVSRAFYGSIIGAQGSVRRRIEDETRTSINVPRQLQDGDVTVTGQCRRDVVLAKKHLQATVMAARNKRSFTHFLSIPLTDDQIKTNFSRFKARVLEQCPYLNPELFLFPETLHLTLEMLVLTDDAERKDACERLHRLPAILAPLLLGKELRVDVRGIAYFTDDPSMVNVLYAKVCDPVLQQIADATSSFFKKSGLTKSVRDENSVKLHMTVMNSKFIEKDTTNRIPFDATPIFQALGDFYFGTVTLRTLHLSRLGTRGEDGYYLPSAIIQLPSSSTSVYCSEP